MLSGRALLILMRYSTVGTTGRKTRLLYNENLRSKKVRPFPSGSAKQVHALTGQILPSLKGTVWRFVGVLDHPHDPRPPPRGSFCTRRPKTALRV